MSSLRPWGVPVLIARRSVDPAWLFWKRTSESSKHTAGWFSKAGGYGPQDNVRSRRSESCHLAVDPVVNWSTFQNHPKRVGIDQPSRPAGNDVKREMFAACLEDQAVFRPPQSSQALNSWPSSAFIAASSVRRCSMERMRP